VSGRFRRKRHRIVAHLDPVESVVLSQVLAQLVELLGEAPDDPLAAAESAAPPEDPALRRLLPDGYRDDPEASAELRRYTEGQLRAGKVRAAKAALSALPEGGGTVELDGEGAGEWLSALNDIRLALGTRLDIDDDTDLGEAVNDPELGESYLVYAWLTGLQDSLVEALSGIGQDDDWLNPPEA
jgi:hypothetical protein